MHVGVRVQSERNPSIGTILSDPKAKSLQGIPGTPHTLGRGGLGGFFATRREEIQDLRYVVSPTVDGPLKLC